MSAVERTDSTNKAVVQGCIFRVAVLSALYRLMVRGAGGMCGYLPPIAPHIIMVLLGDLLLHQSESAHDIAPDGGFQACMYAALIVNGLHASVCQVPRGPSDCGVVIRRPG